VTASVAHFSNGFVGKAETAADAAPPPDDAGGVVDSGDVHDAAVGCGTLAGKVHAPNGTLPLYGALVYVTKSPVPPLGVGPSCGACAALPAGAYAARTSTDGSFVLGGVPDGDGYSLVVEIGKWRRTVTLPPVTCGASALPDELTRLPKNKSEGSLPAIAIATGGGDSLECMLRRIGVDDAEFTSNSGSGRVHLYTGVGAATTLGSGAPLGASTTLWQSSATLGAYDAVLLSCEAGINAQTKPAASLQALSDYLSVGGRVLATHFHHYWFSSGPGLFPSVATWATKPAPPNPSVGTVDQSTPKGVALASSLVAAKASTTAGSLTVVAPTHMVDAVSASAQSRLTVPDPVNGTAVEYMTFDTPVGVAPNKACGRVAYSAMHTGNGDALGAAFPNGCASTPLTNNEVLLAYALFDATACTLP
jgi:hypothetical protein